MRRSSISLLCLAILATHALVAAPQVDAGGRAQKTRQSAAADAQVAVAVTSEPKADRPGQTIALDWKTLVSRLPALKPDRVLVADLATGKQVAPQTVDANGDGHIDELIFQSDFAAREPTKVFLIKAAGERVQAVEPRKDASAKGLSAPLKVSFLTKASRGNGAVQSWSKKVADTILATYPDYKSLNQPRWHYENGFLLAAIFELWQRDKDPKYLQYIKTWVSQYVKDNGALDEKTFNKEEYQLDDILPGRLLISLHRPTGEEKYKKAAYELTEQLKRQPRTKEGGYWHKNVYAHQMWLDGLYMAGPYSVEFAQAFNEPRLFDEAAHQIILIYQRTHDPKTGLLFHGWDESKSLVWADPQKGTSPEFWARAMGWYMMAIVDCLDSLPMDHPKRSELIKVLQSLSASLAKYQDQQTGLWYQVVDKGSRPDNWHETSATAMFAYALAKGVRKGYLDARYRAIASKAYQGILDHHVYLDEAGRFYLTGTVYVGTLNPKVSKGDYESYVSTARQANDIKGVAAFLWASLEMEKIVAR